MVKLPNTGSGISFMDFFKLEPSDEEKLILERYVAPHPLKSRKVLEEDLPRVMDEAKILYTLCFLPRGQYTGGEAVAHSQIDDKDPLQLFVLKSKEIILNSEIVNHTDTLISKEEGCLTFPEDLIVKTERWNKVTIKYQTLTPEGKLSDWITENVNGLRSQIMQHEQDHNDGVYIYKITK